MSDRGGWARRESKREYPTDFDPQERTNGPVEADAASWGIVHAFSALLSDEAVEAAAHAFHASTRVSPGDARAALQAAITAVTKGGTE